MKKYRLHCQTDNKYEYVISSSEPTECPTDAGHTIDSNSVVVISDNYKEFSDVTPRQIRTALFLSMGLSEADIDAAINTLTSPTKEVALIEWKNSTSFERDRPLVATMGTMLGKTEAELDSLWVYAGTL